MVLLDFLLANQEKLSSLHMQTQTREEIRDQCEQLLLEKPFLPFSHYCDLSPENEIPHYVPADEYQHIFLNKNKTPFFSAQEIMQTNIFSIFSSPLSEEWKDLMLHKGDNQFAIRTGFYKNEFEIYQSICLGFQGLTMYVLGLDKFEIQYLTEIARDYCFSLFFVVHNRDELNLVLETDAPYIILSPYQKNNFSIDTSVFYKLSQFVPKSALLFALAPRDILKNKKDFTELGFSYFIVS